MKRKTIPKIEELIPDESKRKEVLERLYKGDAILGDGGIFTEMLQTFVNAALEGEIESRLDKGRAIGVSNRRNGNTYAS